MQEQAKIKLSGLKDQDIQVVLNRLVDRACANARGDLLSYIQIMKDDYIVGKHIRLIADKLMAVARGEIKRLMIFLSPRSGKSLLGSVYFPSWYLGLNPSHQVMTISYSSEMAEDWSREVRNLVASPQYQSVFPGMALRTDSRAANRWRTLQGGIYTAAGTTGGIAGKGAHLAIIDDPMSEQDAYSKAARERVIRWYPGGLRTRLMPKGAIVVISTKWHDNDLPGWLEEEAKKNPKADQWEILKIPAIVDEKASRLLGIEVGESYFPEFWPLSELELTKENTPLYQWEALYMQSPVPEGGAILKRPWWRWWMKDKPPECEYVLMTCDTAFTVESYSDYTAILVWGVWRDQKDVPNLVLLGALNERLEYPDLRRRVNEMYQEHEPDCVLIEKKASGISLIQDLRLSGLPVQEWKIDKDKEARAWAAAPLLESGRVWVPQKKWAEEVVEQCSRFPMGSHDDLVDATTMAILWVHAGFKVEHPDNPEFKEDEDSERKLKKRKCAYA